MMIRKHLSLGRALLLALFVMLLWIVGLALVVSLLGALLPDLAEVVGLVMEVVFYTAPIVYPVALVQSIGGRTLIQLNPCAAIRPDAVVANDDVLADGVAAGRAVAIGPQLAVADVVGGGVDGGGKRLVILPEQSEKEGYGRYTQHQ